MPPRPLQIARSYRYLACPALIPLTSSLRSRVEAMQAQLALHEAAGQRSGWLPCAEQQQLALNPTSGAVKGLPRFDPYVMETYLDDLRDLKRQVYDLFKFRPELLPVVEEGMSKGERGVAGSVNRIFVRLCWRMAVLWWHICIQVGITEYTAAASSHGLCL